jgi:hypothetical protein
MRKVKSLRGSDETGSGTSKTRIQTRFVRDPNHRDTEDTEKAKIKFIRMVFSVSSVSLWLML